MGAGPLPSVALQVGLHANETVSQSQNPMGLPGGAALLCRDGVDTFGDADTDLSGTALLGDAPFPLGVDGVTLVRLGDLELFPLDTACALVPAPLLVDVGWPGNLDTSTALRFEPAPLPPPPRRTAAVPVDF